MSKILEKRTDLQGHYPFESPYHKIIASRIAVFQKPDHVYKIHSTKSTGMNRHSDKRYFRWENDTIHGIRRNRNGNIVAYFIYRKQHRSPENTWGMLTVPTRHYEFYSEKHPSQVFRDAVQESLGISHWHDVYPVAKYYNVPQYYYVPQSLLGALRAQSSREFVERLYGKRMYRKDLLKATGNTSDLATIDLSLNFKGLVPIDWIVDFLRNNAEYRLDYNFSTPGFSGLAQLLGQIDPRSYKHLLAQPITQHIPYLIWDTVRFTEQNGLADEEGNRFYRTWQDLHDRNAQRNFYRRSFFEDVEVELTSLAKKIHGLGTKSFEIKTATHTTDLTKWGEAMHNCIGGYRQLAVRGSGIYGGVYQNSKLIANFEIIGSNLKQLLGPCNRPLSKNQRVELEAAFKSKGVKVDSYWGKNDML